MDGADIPVKAMLSSDEQLLYPPVNEPALLFTQLGQRPVHTKTPISGLILRE